MKLFSLFFLVLASSTHAYSWWSIGGGDALPSTAGVDTITLTAVDEESGLRGIYYTVDIVFSTQGAITYTAPFYLSIGTHTVYYTAVDNVGNQAAVKSVNIIGWNSNVACGVDAGQEFPSFRRSNYPTCAA